MELAIDLGIGGWALVVVGAIWFGIGAAYVGQPTSDVEWYASMFAAGLGALIASEFLVGLRSAGVVWDGLALGPALVGGLILGALVALAFRVTTARPSGRARPT
jgi:hypothetical protein